VQCASWLLKYIPGQVGAVANKVVWAVKKQISRVLVVVTFVYENLFLVFASFVPSLIILAAVLGFEVIGRNAATLLLPALALLPLALVAYKPFFHRIMSLLLRRAIKQDVPERFFLSTPQLMRFVGEFLGPRVLNGIGFVLIAGTVVDLTPLHCFAFAAAYVLGGAIGLLAIGVPSGLGVREAVIVVILGQFTSVAEAIVIALLARLISTLGDGIVALLYAVIRRTVPKEFRP
jgi:glycosyltransferase 2 family protein